MVFIRLEDIFSSRRRKEESRPLRAAVQVKFMVAFSFAILNKCLQIRHTCGGNKWYDMQNPWR